jgi:hypothetical protein
MPTTRGKVLYNAQAEGTASSIVGGVQWRAQKTAGQPSRFQVIANVSPVTGGGVKMM